MQTNTTSALTCDIGYFYNQTLNKCVQNRITNPNTQNLITNNMTLYRNYYI